MLLLDRRRRGSNSVAECQLPKLNVAGSSPVSRSIPSDAHKILMTDRRPLNATCSSGEERMKTLAMLVGGGPAPGINGVIAAATIEARNHGVRVLGFYDGFKWLARGDTSHVMELEIDGISRIHFEGGSILRTSRTNPAKSPETLRHVVEALDKLGVSSLLTIGGDDTAFAACRLSEVVKGRVALGHVPKTIDNDLPLPQEVPTFGYTTACNLGKDIVKNLMEDAETTDRWFFVTVMGRRAGHLALGIGGAAGATLTVIGEEFPEPTVPLQALVDILEGAIIKRRASGKGHG